MADIKATLSWNIHRFSTRSAFRCPSTPHIDRYNHWGLLNPNPYSFPLSAVSCSEPWSVSGSQEYVQYVPTQQNSGKHPQKFFYICFWQKFCLTYFDTSSSRKSLSLADIITEVLFIHLHLVLYPVQRHGVYPGNTVHKSGIHPGIYPTKFTPGAI